MQAQRTLRGNRGRGRCPRRSSAGKHHQDRRNVKQHNLINIMRLEFGGKKAKKVAKLEKFKEEKKKRRKEDTF